MTTHWHIPDEALGAWLEGASGPADSASIEQHLVACTECRARTRRAPVDGLDLDDAWYGIAARIAGHRRSQSARMARRLGADDADAIELASTPAFRLAWLSAVGLVLVAVLALGAWYPDQALGAYLVVAPILPLLGVAATFGAHVDPTYELRLTTPRPQLRSLLIRSANVLLASLPVVTAAGALLEPWWVGLLMVAPALAFVVTSLAVATCRPPAQATAIVGVGWVSVATVAVSATDPLHLVGRYAMIVFMSLTAVGVVAVVVRRDRFASPAFGI